MKIDMKTNKVYRVQIGKIWESADEPNFSEEKVVASDVLAAVKKLRLKKDEYISEIELIAVLTK